MQRTARKKFHFLSLEIFSFFHTICLLTLHRKLNHINYSHTYLNHTHTHMHAQNPKMEMFLNMRSIYFVSAQN